MYSVAVFKTFVVLFCEAETIFAHLMCEICSCAYRAMIVTPGGFLTCFNFNNDSRCSAAAALILTTFLLYVYIMQMVFDG